jgi:phenylalanyl-tRNA synthetase beta chain
VVLEVAYFTPERIARSGQALGLTSDARSRFERGVDPAFLDDGLEILTGLIIDICGGEASSLVRAGTPPLERKRVAFDGGHTSKLGGLDVAEERQREVLSMLGFEMEGQSAVVPTWRRDVDGPADLVEEICRIEGLDRIPSTPLDRADGVARPTATRTQLIERRLRRVAGSRGLDEAVTWSFIAEDHADALGGAAWRIANPISEDMKVMRPSLLPGLIAAARRNLDRGASTVRLFEIGRRYCQDGERPTMTVLLAGQKAPRGWQAGKAQPFDPYDAKAEALALLDSAAVPVGNLQLLPDAGPAWHPGRSAKLGLGPKTILATFGELHPRLAKLLDAPPGAVAADLYLDAIPAPRASGRTRPAFAPPPLQAVARDFAFFVPADLEADSLLRAIRAADRQSITGVRLFDRFEGAEGLSLAVEVILQPTEKSFTDAELTAIAGQIVSAAEKLGARLRG